MFLFLSPFHMDILSMSVWGGVGLQDSELWGHLMLEDGPIIYKSINTKEEDSKSQAKLYSSCDLLGFNKKIDAYWKAVVSNSKDVHSIFSFNLKSKFIVYWSLIVALIFFFFLIGTIPCIRSLVYFCLYQCKQRWNPCSIGL